MRGLSGPWTIMQDKWVFYKARLQLHVLLQWQKMTKIANIFMFLKINSPWEGLTRECCCHSGVREPVPLHHAVNRYHPHGHKAVISPLHWLLMSWNCLDRSAGGVTGALNHKQMSLFLKSFLIFTLFLALLYQIGPLWRLFSQHCCYWCPGA